MDLLKINVRGTLANLPVGGQIKFGPGIKSSYLRTVACVIGQDNGMKLRVNKVSDGFLVTRES